MGKVGHGVPMNEARLRRLIRVGQVVVAELDLDRLLTRILDEARELTGARYAALGVLDEAREQLERFLTSGIDPDAHAAIGELPRGRGVLGVLIDDPKPLRLEDVGMHPRSYGFPVGHPPMRSFLGVPVVIDGVAWGNLYLTEKASGPFDEDDEEATILLADWAAIAINNARQYTGVSARRDDLENAVRGFEASMEIAHALGGETSLGRILELIVKRGRALVGAGKMALALVEGDELVVHTVAGEISPSMVGFRFSTENAMAGYVVRTGRPMRLQATDGRVRAVLADQVGARTGLTVPLAFRRQRLGVLAAYDRMDGDGEFSTDDERLLVGFAASAATAVGTAQAMAGLTLRRALEASEAERRRWARELHDATLQDLGALRILLSSARRSDDPDRLRAAVEEAVGQLASAVADLRSIITDLRPAALDELGTEAALRALAERVQARTGIELRLHVDLAWEHGRAPTRHTPELEATMYRLAQEALTNAVKHAGAARISITLVEDEQCVDLTVADDGRGFDPEAEHHGFGLVGMTERSDLAGGSLELNSAPGKGTTVHARLPVARRRDADGDAMVVGLHDTWH
jgi:signal transduction histidine kinase